jgi:hypothetical protein
VAYPMAFSPEGTEFIFCEFCAGNRTQINGSRLSISVFRSIIQRGRSLELGLVPRYLEYFDQIRDEQLAKTGIARSIKCHSCDCPIYPHLWTKDAWLTRLHTLLRIEITNHIREERAATLMEAGDDDEVVGIPLSEETLQLINKIHTLRG